MVKSHAVSTALDQEDEKVNFLKPRALKVIIMFGTSSSLITSLKFDFDIDILQSAIEKTREAVR